MIGKKLWVAKNHGHSVTTMLTDYAAWIEGAQDADIEAISGSIRWNFCGAWWKVGKISSFHHKPFILQIFHPTQIDSRAHRTLRQRGVSSQSAWIVMVSLPRPYPSPTHRAVFRTCVRSSAHPSPHGVVLARLQLQNFAGGVLLAS